LGSRFGGGGGGGRSSGPCKKKQMDREFKDEGDLTRKGELGTLGRTWVSSDGGRRGEERGDISTRGGKGALKELKGN